jgi:pimeloyl-ACP methyl ester carboxylesterase
MGGENFMPFFTRDGLQFNYYDHGEGIPFIFQHGLGGALQQPLQYFSPPTGFRLLSFDFRGHGETKPLGDPEKIGIASFADDLLAFMNYTKVPRAIVGGISMGAAVAMNFAVRFPGYLLGLVLVRPAILCSPLPENMIIFTYIGQLIRKYGAVQGAEIFRKTPEFIEIMKVAPDTAASLLGQFTNPRAEETVARLERIPHDPPIGNLHDLARINVPAFILANRQDPVHLFEYGEILAGAIPGAEFKKITSKSVSKQQHITELHTFISCFLTANFKGQI